MRAGIVSPFLVAAALAGGLALAGCRSVTPPVEGRADPYAAPQVNFASTALRDRTAVMPPTAQRDDAGNLLHVTLDVRNTTTRAFTIDYQVTFFDANGGRLEQTGWLPLPLEAYTPQTIQANSTSGRAADFRISLRMAK